MQSVWRDWDIQSAQQLLESEVKLKFEARAQEVAPQGYWGPLKIGKGGEERVKAYRQQEQRGKLRHISGASVQKQ